MPNIPLALLRSSWLHLLIYLLIKYLLRTYYPAPACKILHSEDRVLFFFKVFHFILRITICVHECRYTVYTLRCNQHARPGKTGGNRQCETFFMCDTEQGVFPSTPFLKCIALGMLSDKLPPYPLLHLPT